MNLGLFNRKPKKNKATATRDLKSLCVLNYWCSSHKNCFKGTIGKGETEIHLDAKYERWKHWRKCGCDVYVELRLSNGLRPDLTVIKPNGDIFHEEIIVSEKKESIAKKIKYYPFVVRCHIVGKK